MTRKPTWTEVSETRYDEMLGILPPEAMTGIGFLVGEPSDHALCSVRGGIAAIFQPFATIGGKFYGANSCMTVAEFRRLTEQDVLGALVPA